MSANLDFSKYVMTPPPAGDDLPPSLVSGILKNESGGRHYDARGNVKLGPVTRTGKRAIGKWQVMPDALGGRTRAIGGQTFDLYDEAQNEQAGRAYLSEGLKAARGDPQGAALYYFGGPGALNSYRRTGRIPQGDDLHTTMTAYVRGATGQDAQTPDFSKYVMPTPTPTPSAEPTPDFSKYVMSSPAAPTPPVQGEAVRDTPTILPSRGTTQSSATFEGVRKGVRGERVGAFAGVKSGVRGANTLSRRGVPQISNPDVNMDELPVYDAQTGQVLPSKREQATQTAQALGGAPIGAYAGRRAQIQSQVESDIDRRANVRGDDYSAALNMSPALREQKVQLEVNRAAAQESEQTARDQQTEGMLTASDRAEIERRAKAGATTSYLTRSVFNPLFNAVGANGDEVAAGLARLAEDMSQSESLAKMFEGLDPHAISDHFRKSAYMVRKSVEKADELSPMSATQKALATGADLVGNVALMEAAAKLGGSRAAFGGVGFLSSRGRGESYPEAIGEGVKQEAIRNVFEHTANMPLVQRAATVYAATVAIEKASGATDEQAVKSATTNAGFVGLPEAVGRAAKFVANPRAAIQRGIESNLRSGQPNESVPFAPGRKNPPVEPAGGGPTNEEIPPVGTSVEGVTMNPPEAEVPPQHHELQPRRVRKTETGTPGQFKKETATQREARRAQVEGQNETATITRAGETVRLEGQKVASGQAEAERPGGETKVFPENQTRAREAEGQSVRALVSTANVMRHGALYAETRNGERLQVQHLPVGRVTPLGDELVLEDGSTMPMGSVSKLEHRDGTVIYEARQAPREVSRVPSESEAGAGEKQPHEMTYEEIKERGRQLANEKEPWEMSRDEFDVYSRADFYPDMGVHSGNEILAQYDKYGRVDGERRWVIERALEQGKTVPPEVLKDYPDLSVGGTPVKGEEGAREKESTLDRTVQVRRTLVKPEIVNALPIEKRQRVLDLVNEYNGLNYVDASLVLPDQWARVSKRQQAKMQNTASRVFAIENEVKQLIKPEAQVQREATETELKQLDSRQSQLERQRSDLQSMFGRQLASPRPNKYKTTLTAVERELADVAERRASVAAPSTTRAEATVEKPSIRTRAERPNPRTGLNKTQTTYLADELEKVADKHIEENTGEADGHKLTASEFKRQFVKDSDSRIPPNFLDRPMKEPVTIKVPDDGEFTIRSAAQANRLHQKITGEPIEGFEKAERVSKGLPAPSRSIRLSPREQEANTDVDAIIQAYGSAERAHEALSKVAAQLDADPEVAKQMGGDRGRMDGIISELKGHVDAERELVTARESAKRLESEVKAAETKARGRNTAALKALRGQASEARAEVNKLEFYLGRRGERGSVDISFLKPLADKIRKVLGRDVPELEPAFRLRGKREQSEPSIRGRERGAVPEPQEGRVSSATSEGSQRRTTETVGAPEMGTSPRGATDTARAKEPGPIPEPISVGEAKQPKEIERTNTPATRSRSFPKSAEEGDYLTGAKVAVTRAERERLGQSQADLQAWKSVEDSYNAGRSQVEQGRVDPQKIAEEVAKKPRPLTADEVGALTYERAKILTQHDIAFKDALKAMDANSEVDAAEARIRMEGLEERLRTNSDALEKGGREQSAAFNARKMLVKADYSLAQMVDRYRAETGKEPSAEVRAKIEAQAVRIKELEGKLAEHQERLAKQDAENAVGKMKRDAAREARASRRTQTKQTLDEEFASLKAQFAKAKAETKGVQAAGLAGLDPEGKLTPLVLKMARNRVKAGVNTVEGVVDEIHFALKEHVEGLTKRDVRDAISGYGREPQGVRSELQKQLDRLKSEARRLSTEEDVASGVRESARLKAAKSRIQKQIEEYERRINQQDFSKRERSELVYDREGNRLKVQLESTKQDYENLKERDRLQNRPGWEKSLDLAVRWGRFAKLSYLSTMGKLTSAATGRIITNPLEEMVGGIESKLMPSLARRAPREGGLSIKAEVESVSRLWKKESFRAFLDKLKTGQSDLDLLYGSTGKALEEQGIGGRVLGVPGRAHGAMKELPRQAEFYRAFEKRLEYKAREGADIKDPVVQQATAMEAYADAQRTILMQPNFISDAFNRTMRSWEREGGSRRKVAAKLMRLEFPITRIPVNFAGEALNYTFGSVRAGAQTTYLQGRALGRGVRGKGFKSGFAELTPEQADSLMRAWKKGGVGLGMVALGFLSPGTFGGYYQRGEKRERDEPDAGELRLFGHNLPRWAGHIPILEAAQFGATMRRVYDATMKKEDSKLGASESAIIGAGEGLLKEVPFYEDPLRFAEAVQGKAEGVNRFFGQQVRGMIPGAFQEASRYRDHYPSGETVKRKREGFVDEVIEGTPWRKNLSIGPVFGTQPSKGSEEVQRLGMQVRGVERKDDETAPKYEARKARTNPAIGRAIDRTVSSGRYQNLPDEKRREAIRGAIRSAIQ